jgi:hypothetical protein
MLDSSALVDFWSVLQQTQRNLNDMLVRAAPARPLCCEYYLAAPISRPLHRISVGGPGHRAPGAGPHQRQGAAVGAARRQAGGGAAGGKPERGGAAGGVQGEPREVGAASGAQGWPRHQAAAPNAMLCSTTRSCRRKRRGAAGELRGGS